MLKKTQTKKPKLYQDWLRLLIIVLLIIGTFFRFVNLEQKPYWGDESLTSQRIAGYTSKEFVEIIRHTNGISVDEMQKYQRPNSDKDLFDVMKTLADHAEHPPLYYLMARFWMQLFRDHGITPRGLSTFVSLLAFPSIYWLCLELFESSTVGWIALGILAISPFHFIYAQEARQYSLWTVTILLSTWALLRAIRLNNKLNWGIYIITLSLMLYTSLISVMVSIGHGVYVLTIQSFRFSKITIAYLVTSIISFLLFLPWIIVIIYDSKGEVDKYVAWTQKSVPLASLLQSWFININRIFWDFNNSFSYNKLLIYLSIITLVLYSIYFLYIYTPKKIWLLIFTLIAMPILFLIFPDLVSGGMRSTSIRYLTPMFLGIQISMAYLLTNKITYEFIKTWEQKLWKIVTVVLFSSGIISCLMFTQADTWWNKYLEYYHTEVANIVNQTKNPIILAPWYEIRSLSYSLKPNVVLYDISLQKEINFEDQKFTNVFIYKRKDFLKYFLANNLRYYTKNTYSWKKQTTPVNTTATTLWHLTAEK